MEKNKKTGSDECCWTERHIGYEVCTLNQIIGRLVNSYQSKVDEKAGINRMQGWIIGYLYRHSEETVFQKDLEAEFQMARSTASGILQAMEKKGLITRESIPRDARLKRLVLTEKGMEFQMEIMENFERIQKVLKSDISQEKLECFMEVLDMIRENAQRECSLRDEN
ncbi:MAG: MarR family winged helix-turn-helix transcriptional regulator [Blautia sp.]